MVLNTDRTAEKPIKMILYREKMCSESFCCPACNERLVNTVSLSYSRVITVSFCFLLFFFSPSLCFYLTPTVRFKVLSNNHLQIRGIKKTDEGDYTCEGRIMARGEIDLRVIKVIVNGEDSISEPPALLLHMDTGAESLCTFTSGFLYRIK